MVKGLMEMRRAGLNRLCNVYIAISKELYILGDECWKKNCIDMCICCKLRS